jgi:hypothetical protein
MALSQCEDGALDALGHQKVGDLRNPSAVNHFESDPRMGLGQAGQIGLISNG